MDDPPRLQFGLVPPASFVRSDERVNALLRWVGERAQLSLVRRQVASYDDLARLLRGGVLHVAWLPPILFARLDLEGVVRELVCAERGEAEPFVAALVVRAGSGITALTDLRGKRIGWVDPLSATGYVVPRIRLAAAGFPPSGLFRRETFFGSHAAVVRAVLDDIVDVGATYAGFGAHGELLRGAFSEVGARADELAVVESFGAVPSDVIAVHASVGDLTADRLAEALEATREDAAMLEAVRTTFGALRFARKPLAGYDMLRTEIAVGVDSGVIPAAAAFLSTRPPTR